MSTIVVFSMVLLQESTSTSASSEVETRQVRGADEVGRGEAGAQEGEGEGEAEALGSEKILTQMTYGGLQERRTAEMQVCLFVNNPP